MTMRSEFTRAAVVLFSMCLISTFGEPSDRNSERESWQPPEQILDAAGVRAGMKIGEAGAGTGYLTFHLAERVGPE